MIRVPIGSRRALIQRLASIPSHTHTAHTAPSSSSSSFRQAIRSCSTSRIADTVRSPAEEPVKIAGFADVEEVRETAEPTGM